MNYEDPESRNSRLMQCFDDIAQSNKLIARYLFWIRIWIFVSFGMLIAIMAELGDIKNLLRGLSQ